MRWIHRDRHLIGSAVYSAFQSPGSSNPPDKIYVRIASLVYNAQHGLQNVAVQSPDIEGVDGRICLSLGQRYFKPLATQINAYDPALDRNRIFRGFGVKIVF